MSLLARLTRLRAQWYNIRQPLPSQDQRRYFIQGPYAGQGVCTKCGQIYALTDTTATAEPDHFCSQACETVFLTHELETYRVGAGAC